VPRLRLITCSASGLLLLPRTDCCFSPDDRLLVTGTSVKRNQGNGTLAFFDRTSFQKVYEVEVTNAVSPAALSILLYCNYGCPHLKAGPRDTREYIMTQTEHYNNNNNNNTTTLFL